MKDKEHKKKTLRPLALAFSEQIQIHLRDLLQYFLHLSEGAQACLCLFLQLAGDGDLAHLAIAETHRENTNRPRGTIPAVPFAFPAEPLRQIDPNTQEARRLPLVLVVDPCMGPEVENGSRPPNGMQSPRASSDASSDLTVENGNGEDAAVILEGIDAGGADRLMYVRGRMKATMPGIAPGRYRILFQIGKFWDAGNERFLCINATAIFEDPETFYEKEETEGRTHSVHYSSVTITLHKVIGGNARTRPMNATSFRRHGRRVQQ